MLASVSAVRRRPLTRLLVAALPLAVAATTLTLGTGCETTGGTASANANVPTKIQTYGIADRDLPSDVAWELVDRRAYDKRLQIKMVKMAGPIIGDDQLREMFGTVFDPGDPDAVSKIAYRGAKDIPVSAFEGLIPDAERWLVTELVEGIAGGGDTKNILIVRAAQDTLGNEAQANEALQFALNNLKSRLQRSDIMQGYFIFLSDDEELGKEALQSATNGKAIGMFDPTNPAAGQQAMYPPEKVFLVKSTFAKLEEINETNPSTSKLKFSLFTTVEHPIQRREYANTVITESFTLHPFRAAWISDTENQALENAYREAKRRATGD